MIENFNCTKDGIQTRISHTQTEQGFKMKTMKQTEKLDADWLTEEQKGVCDYWLKKGGEVYAEGPYMCSFHKKQYGYMWVDTGKKLLKLDGRGYDIKMQCEIHPKIV